MSHAEPRSGRELDLIAIGRTCVDLYAEQSGAPLERVQSFRAYVGGSAANIAVGTARLGRRAALLSRVGDEQLGYLVRERLDHEGVDTRWLGNDPERLTPLVALAVRPSDDFPRVFYYDDPADLALTAEDVDAAPIASARALLIGGTALSRLPIRSAVDRALDLAAEGGTRVALDLDFRPVLWGLAPPREGRRMVGGSAEVTAAYAGVLGRCDLVVGTEEEFRAAAGGAVDTAEALRRVRSETSALLVVKSGASGAVAYEGPVDDGAEVTGFPVEVFNSVGAGDAFMTGFLDGWLTQRPIEECMRLANACGALVVSRHGCSPAMPSRPELEYFLDRADQLTRPRDDAWLSHLHRVTKRRPAGELQVLAIDHRWQLEEAAEELGAARDRLVALKDLMTDAFLQVAEHLPSAGVLLDDVYGSGALERLSTGGAWVARAVEIAGSWPVALRGGANVSATLRTWPRSHVVKCMVYCHPGDDPAVWRTQEERVIGLAQACADLDRELLLEIQAPSGASYRGEELAETLERFYQVGVRPDWWKLPPVAEASTWKAIGDVVRQYDPYCQGLLVLGQSMSDARLAASFAAAADEPLCRGFAVGRSIFADPARAWLAGEIEDDRLVSQVAANYRRISELWAQRR